MRDLSCDIAVEHMIDGVTSSIRFSRSLLRRETVTVLLRKKKGENYLMHRECIK